MLYFGRIVYVKRTYDEINEKITAGKASVLTAQEAKAFIKEQGVKKLLTEIDLVTCASFEMHTNALLYLNFGQTDPMIYFSDVHINNVSAYSLGPTDLALSLVASSSADPKYSGASVLEELVNKKDVHLKTTGRHLEVFPNKEFETWFKLGDLNNARLLLNQAVSQNNIVATNSGDKDINSHMGTLISHIENSTFNSSSYLNPLINDPFCKTIGVGSSIWIAGSQGVIIGHGSNHNPTQKKNSKNIPVGPGATLSAIADVSSMDPKWVKAGYIKSFGPVLYVGVGLPIPILDESVAESLSVTDNEIQTTIVDFSIPRRTKPTFGQCTYSELRTSTVVINGKPTLTAPLSSMAYALEICKSLKEDIKNKKFFLREFVSSLDMQSSIKKLDSRLGELV